jgi:putative zinc finger/helix-turn-helix YgiT family protein
MKTMKCFQCGSAMTTNVENVPYKSLPGTVLAGVNVSRCAACGEYEVAIPAIDELNRMLANAVIRQKRRLNGGEIRFLRTYLGVSGADFAKMIRSAAATVSRWENDTQPIGHHADLLLRTLVMLDTKVESYPIKDLAEVSDEEAKPVRGPRYAFTPSSAKRWKPAEVQL